MLLGQAAPLTFSEQPLFAAQLCHATFVNCMCDIRMLHS